MIEGFVNPALAAGVALASVPIIIHLLNRQRHKPVEWAAMRFVLAAYRKTRRRVQVENWLLLLLRALAVAALALAVARPFASGGGALEGLRESRRDLVLLIDGSASTGYRDGLGSVFERVVERAGELVDDLDGAGGDRVQVVFCGAWPRLMSWATPDEARALLSTLNRPTDEPLDLAAALGAVAELAGVDAGGIGSGDLDVRLLTDLQASAFRGEAFESLTDDAPTSDEPLESSESASGDLVRVLDLLKSAEVRVLVEDLGPAIDRPANLSVESIETLDEVPPPGGSVDVAVSVRNQGGEDKLAERVWLEVDGERLPSQRVDVPAGGLGEAVFTVAVTKSGALPLLAGTAGDGLAVDDTRATVLRVPPPMEVLVVNGSPSDRFEDDETALLVTVLEPPDEGFLPGLAAAAPFAPTETTPAFLAAEESGIESADVIVLANVGPLPRATIERIERRVAAGAGLFITCGDRLGDLRLWSEELFRADGSGLLPVEPQERVSTSRRESYYRVGEFDAAHPAVTFFADETWQQLLTEVPFYEFVAGSPVEGAQVVARLDDARGTPLLVERRFGAGRVAFWASTISSAWNLVPESPGTFVPLVHELTKHLGRRTLEDRTVAPGTPLRLVADDFLQSPELVRPDGATRIVTGDLNEREDGRWDLPALDASDTLEAGLYEMRAPGSPSEWFAVQLDPTEGDLARATPREVEAVHPALRMAEGSERSTAENDGDSSGEIWRLLAAAALLFVILESLWGAWVGQRRARLTSNTNEGGAA